jgi:tRNA nucleotidyltransferase (CCA-adding enzyme)
MRLQVGYDQRSRWHELTLWEHSCLTLCQLPQHLNLRWAGWLHDIGKPFVRTDKPDRSNYVHHELVGADIVYGLGKRLKWSSERLEAVSVLVREHMTVDNELSAADNRSKTRADYRRVFGTTALGTTDTNAPHRDRLV